MSYIARRILQVSLKMNHISVDVAPSCSLPFSAVYK